MEDDFGKALRDGNFGLARQIKERSDRKRRGDELQARWRARIPPGSVWLHKKTEEIYTVVDIALLQTSDRYLVNAVDGTAVVIYTSAKNPGPFTRRCEEFADGRFYRLDPSTNGPSPETIAKVLR